jgi:DNA polymerase (family 10)
MTMEKAPPSNAEVARIFAHIADVLEIQGENPFKIRAYRKVVETLNTLPEPVAQIAAEKRLNAVLGFGVAIQGKIMDILATGTTALHERTKDAVPTGVLAMLALPGVGAKTIRLAWLELGVESIDALDQAARTGKIAMLPGLSEKTAQKIVAAIELIR